MVDATLGTKPEFDPATSRRHFSIVASDYVAGVLLDVLQAVHQEAPGLTSLGSLWLRERILQFAQALPALPVAAGG